MAVLIGSRLAGWGWGRGGGNGPGGLGPPGGRGRAGKRGTPPGGGAPAHATRDGRRPPRRAGADDAGRRGPAFGGVAELGPSSALVLVALGAAHAEIVGEDADLRMQHVVPGEPEDVIDAVRLAPSHCRGTGIVAIATPADAGLGPMPTDVAGAATGYAAGVGTPPRAVPPPRAEPPRGR